MLSHEFGFTDAFFKLLGLGRFLSLRDQGKELCTISLDNFEQLIPLCFLLSVSDLVVNCLNSNFGFDIIFTLFVGGKEYHTALVSAHLLCDSGEACFSWCNASQSALG